MKKTKQIATIVLILLLGVIAYGSFRTRRSTTASQIAAQSRVSQNEDGAVIDQAPLQTARRFAQMPTSADESPLAQEALRLGDREMDLAFAAGVLDAQDHPATLSAEAKESQLRLQDAESTLDRDGARVSELSAATAKAKGAKADDLDRQLQQAKVQAQLDQDEVDNAKQELALAGGDVEGRIEELMKEHEAASRIADSTSVNIATPPDIRGLVRYYLEWSRLRDKIYELRHARQEAESAAAAFAKKRDALKSSVKTNEQEIGSSIPGAASNSVASTRGYSAGPGSTTKRRSDVVKQLTNSNERVEDQKKLAET
jgi:hypothetical protein